MLIQTLANKFLYKRSNAGSGGAIMVDVEAENFENLTSVHRAESLRTCLYDRT